MNKHYAYVNCVHVMKMKCRQKSEPKASIKLEIHFSIEIENKTSNKIRGIKTRMIF